MSNESSVDIKLVVRFEVTCDDHGLVGQYDTPAAAKVARSGHLTRQHDRSVALERARKAAEAIQAAEQNR